MALLVARVNKTSGFTESDEQKMTQVLAEVPGG